MKKYINPFISIILILSILAVMFYSIIFVGNHEKHQCTGKHCEVCVQLRNVESTLRQIGYGLIVSLSILLSLNFLKEKFSWEEINLLFSSPVTKKVRMNR
jgi:hypothetical protein